MSATPNITKGKQLVLQIRNDADTAWEVAGGVKIRGFNVENPVDDTTNSSTPSDYSEGEWTGYSKMTLNVSGMCDKRTGTDAATGLALVGASRLTTLATTGNRCATFRLVNLDEGGNIEGVFNITSYGKTGETPGLLSFEATLESGAAVTVTGAV